MKTSLQIYVLGVSRWKKKRNKQSAFGIETDSFIVDHVKQLSSAEPWKQMRMGRKNQNIINREKKKKKKEGWRRKNKDGKTEGEGF